jgi:methylglutaconyl-CoA hydratase
VRGGRRKQCAGRVEREGARGGCRDRRRHGAGSTAPALLLLALLLLARLVLVLCCGALQLLLLCGGALRRRTALIVVAGLTGRMAAVRAVRLAAHADGFATLTLTRGERHNALSDAVIGVMRAELAAVRRLAPRALFVRAEGKSFSAGADLEWMKRAAGYSRAENTADALELSGMLNDLATLPMPTVALVQGQALGGGVGLVAACDVAVGVRAAKFTLSEVKLGLIPATISPYVLRRIGAQHGRRYFLTAERFDAAEAQRIGLLHHVVEDEAALDAFEKHLKEHFAVNGPAAMAASKELIAAVEGRGVTPEVMFDTAQRLAVQRDTPECREGIAAFFDKRAPAYKL